MDKYCKCICSIPLSAYLLYWVWSAGLPVLLLALVTCRSPLPSQHSPPASAHPALPQTASLSETLLESQDCSLLCTFWNIFSWRQRAVIYAAVSAFMSRNPRTGHSPPVFSLQLVFLLAQNQAQHGGLFLRAGTPSNPWQSIFRCSDFGPMRLLAENETILPLQLFYGLC